jgi:predicted enzyme related to lactoylglutathione lyase
MMGNPVIWFEVSGEDNSGLQSFYSELFGWSVDDNNPIKYGIVNTGSEKGIQGGIGTTQAGTSWVTFYVEVPDIKEVLAKVENMGGRVIVPYTEIPEMVTMAVFADPEGHSIGLVQGQEE